MNETERVSVERHLRKTFPDLEIYVNLSENRHSFNISGRYTMNDRFRIYREFDRYTATNFGWTAEWRVPYY